MTYDFTEHWIHSFDSTWQEIFAQLKPRKILEIGSYEGRSATFSIEHIAEYGGGELHCIDAWEGGNNHDGERMPGVEQRFRANIAKACEKTGHAVKVHVRKGHSNIMLPPLLMEGHRETFDLIYVDGSHMAADVLIDLIYAYELCRPNGVIICDDYLWAPGQIDMTQTPKLAIDSFVNVFRGKIGILKNTPLYQLYLIKAPSSFSV